jgi:hypothetical protein
MTKTPLPTIADLRRSEPMAAKKAYPYSFMEAYEAIGTLMTKIARYEALLRYYGIDLAEVAPARPQAATPIPCDEEDVRPAIAFTPEQEEAERLRAQTRARVAKHRAQTKEEKG